MKHLLVIVILLFAGKPTYATVLNVPGDYSTIQNAIDAATDGDTVLVADGTYYENIKFNGKGIVVASHLVLDGDTQHILNTIINGSQPTHPDTASCVLFINGEDSTSVLEGFTLTGGTGTRWTDEHGAGDYYEGGGILAALSSPIIKHNIITGNEAIRQADGSVSAGGGGIRCGDGNPKIIGNLIYNNKAMYGGGIVLNFTAGLVQNNVIVNNREYVAVAGAPTFGGGGIWINEIGPIEIINNTIAFNSAEGVRGIGGGKGGGIMILAGIFGAKITIYNNIIWGNTQARNTQVTNLSGQLFAEYNIVEDGITGTNNINNDPIFLSSNLYLAENSPAVDAGDPSPEFNDRSEGGSAIWPSLGTERNDMGAYGGPMRFVFPDEVVGVNNEESVKYEFVLEQNYPNPFNPSTKIRFTVPSNQTSKVKLFVYDILGRRVAELVNGYFPAGKHEIEFDASNLSSGTYFYTLENGINRLSRKMLLLK